MLNTLEENLRRNPRFDHRTVIVHFAVSQKDQVDRLAKLGCIVSGNPYYTAALADNYSQFGLGPREQTIWYAWAMWKKQVFPFHITAICLWHQLIHYT
ncbi:hypothetical protein NYZ99_04945 [Maribacter litopenaei]|uniref:Uncharacterized protein n=1 Tax=Maribacter litopenaei TaxID=2976127 RepID=A0ABY5YBY8_9FLAO|nr:hypothetical protein [Maribacter litopenaei]UWX56558.1 hypothetical protein NYZ99_04945 [Maribacter litopenaei]